MRLPQHKAALYVCHNDHLTVYQAVEQWLSNNQEYYAWQSDTERQTAIDTGEVWTMQWYPETPVSCHAIAASTLAGLLRFASTFGEMTEFDENVAEQIRPISATINTVDTSGSFTLHPLDFEPPADRRMYIVFPSDAAGTNRGIARQASAYTGPPEYRVQFTGDPGWPDSPFPCVPQPNEKVFIIFEEK